MSSSLLLRSILDAGLGLVLFAASAQFFQSSHEHFASYAIQKFCPTLPELVGATYVFTESPHSKRRRAPAEDSYEEDAPCEIGEPESKEPATTEK